MLPPNPLGNPLSSAASLSALFIRRPVGTALLMVGLMILGAVAYRFLPVAPLPQVEFPTIIVTASLPGASPETMAASVATPLERRLSRIAGVSEMTSNSKLGSTVVVVQFDLNRDVEAASRDVQAAINAAGGDLPADLPSPPRMRRINPADAPVMTLAMTSTTLAPAELYNLADSVIGQRLSQIEGVAQVTINGAEKTAVRVRVNATAAANMGVSLDAIRTVISQANANGAKGSFDGTHESWAIGASDQLFDADAYRRLIVTERNGAVVRLGDVADVIEAPENRYTAAWQDGHRAILINIQKQPGSNVVDTVDRIRAELPTLRGWMPPGVSLSVRTDRTPTIRASIDDVQKTLAVTVALVVMVMALFLRRLWATVIPAASVPLSLAGTCGVMWIVGYSLDNFSLMALTISVGFVVDDAIVVIENIVRHIEKGARPFEAAVAGTRQVAFTVVSISLSLVAVFIPILFMGGIQGRLFREFAVVLSVAIAVSAVVSLTLTPMMCAHLLRPETERGPTGRLGRALGWVGDRLFGLHAGGLDWVLAHRRAMLLATAAIIGVSVWLYGQVPKGFVPQQDTGLLIGFSDPPPDISFRAMVSRQRALQDAVAGDPAVDSVGGTIGGGGPGGTYSGQIVIGLKPKDERDDLATVIQRLRQRAGKVPGVQLYLTPVQDIRVGGFQGRSQYRYSLQDADISALNEWAPKLVDKMRTLPELVDVANDRQNGGVQANVIVDRDAASRLGVSLSALESTLYDAFGQRQVSTMYLMQNQHKVVLEVEPSEALGPDDLKRIFVPGRGGMVPLSAVSRVVIGNQAASIQHQSGFPVANLTFDLAPGVSLSQATELIQRAAEDIGMPASIRAGFQGDARAFQQSASSQPLLILAALITIYIVLGVLYESLIHPLTILSTLPSAGLGALIALILTGYDLSIVALIGIILLVGIVKKNAIMMIDFALEAERTRGLSPLEAIREAGLVRFRPIMMTTMAALLGAVPLAFDYGTGGEIRRPLGIAIIGGLLVSQMLTLYTTPVVYLTLERLALRRHRRAAIAAPAE
ncbi:RND superfamily, multidrug transport protein (plasmid) [Azospirillum sp. B510]|uniref:efflux RND transporter permease subunit n=1 Tax=Azospirillum sp. (strain B510) TaxID=137722 RepID=UPI0001C4CE5C|nr:efflux RND transporter permease subunit [Azospirillum sp. B510]BAI76274.1 RND superfamily, multidrug transport protein [Azospirillum sp. B510]